MSDPHKFTMNTSLRNAMIFDDDSWDCNETPAKNTYISDDSNSNETSTVRINFEASRNTIKRELFDDESHSPLKRAFNSIQIKQEDTPIKVKQERFTPIKVKQERFTPIKNKSEDGLAQNRRSPALRSFEDRLRRDGKSTITRHDDKSLCTKQANPERRQVLRGYRGGRARNEEKKNVEKNDEANAPYNIRIGNFHMKHEADHSKLETDNNISRKRDASPYSFRSYSDRLKQNLESNQGDNASQGWGKNLKTNRSKQRDSPYKKPESSTCQSQLESKKTTLKRDLSRSSREECVRKRRHVEMETDDKVLQRRQRQIDFGKNTVAYDNYIKLIARNKRASDDPATPNKYMKYSRRAWDGLIKQWRLRLHKYDP